jgi:hypothetical protein
LKLQQVSFIKPVSCGNLITQVTSGNTVGDRPGAKPFDAELTEIGGFPCVVITKRGPGGSSTCVPLTNVSNFTPMPGEVVPEKVPAKK